MANGEASKAQIVHAVAVACGGLQATKCRRALAVAGARASSVLPWPYGANPLRTLPWAQSILGVVGAVILNRLVLGVPVRCFPKRAVKGGLFGIWRMEVLDCTLNFVAFIRANRADIAPTREAAGPRLLKGQKVIPLFWCDSNVIPVIRHWRRCGLWWRRSPGVLAHRSQVVAPNTFGYLIPNHRIGILLQSTKPWHTHPAPCPGVECCHPQRCNCSAAFLLRRDLKFCGTRRLTVVELLILWGAIRRRCGRRRGQRRAGRRQRRQQGCRRAGRRRAGRRRRRRGWRRRRRRWRRRRRRQGWRR